jgi:MFS family permease
MSKTAKSGESGTSDPAGADDVASLHRRLLVPTLVLTGSLLAVVSSLGAPLIPTLSRVDGVSLSTGEWILTIALLTGALATPVMGRLADGHRQRDVILIPLGAVLVGCVLAAVSSGFTVLIIGRALQGLGLGLLPVLMAIARRNLPPEKAGRAIATLSVTAVIGVGLGYPLTGLLAQALGFRAAYWFGAIAVAGAIVLAALVLPARSAGTSRHFDVAGAGLLSLAVAGVSVVLSEGGEWGWASARSLGVIVASAVLLAVWIPFELRSADPLVDLRQVRNRSVLTADVSGFLINASLYLLVIMIVEFVQIPRSAGYGFAASLVVSGLVLVPLSVCSFLASRFLVAYEQRFGRRTMIPLGSVVVAVAAVFFAFDHSALWEAFLTIAVSGMGIGFTTAAMPGFIVRAVPPSETGSAMGLYQVMRSIGSSVGSALSAAVLLAHTRHGQALPDVGGFKVTLIIAAALCLITAVVSFALPGRGPSRRNALTVGEERGLDVLMKDEAELGGTGPVRTGRSRDAAASRDALLQAAQTLFGQQGFERTTIREIAEQAGVDAALIARYFGSKADLYIAAVVAEDAEGLPSEYEGLEHMADVMVTRADRRGPGSILQAMVRSDTAADILDAARDRLARRMVRPLVANMRAQGVDRPQLRAEVTASALLGFSLGRSLGWCDEIRSAPRDEEVALIVDALGVITGGDPER